MSLSSSAASIQPEQLGPDEGGNSLHLNRGDSAEGASVSGETDSQTGTGVGESWASEFQRRDGSSEEAGERIEVHLYKIWYRVILTLTDIACDFTVDFTPY
jgi:hypothetical protein